MSKLEIVERRSADVAILELSGKVQIGETSVRFRRSLQRLMQEGEKNILLDLKGVSQVDSCGLGEFVSGYVSLEKKGGKVKLLHLTDRVSELMVITKLVTVFEVYQDEEEAVNSFRNVAESADSEKAAVAAKNWGGAGLSQ